MGDTVREKIMQNVETTLKTISKANGYNNDIASVQRWYQSGNTFSQVPCIVIYGGPEEKEQAPDPLITCRFLISIILCIRHDEEDIPGPTDAILNNLLGDIEKALMVDHKRGGYAVDTIPQSNDIFERIEGQPYAGIVVNVEIHYRHRTNDPEISG